MNTSKHAIRHRALRRGVIMGTKSVLRPLCTQPGTASEFCAQYTRYCFFFTLNFSLDIVISGAGPPRTLKITQKQNQFDRLLSVKRDPYPETPQNPFDKLLSVNWHPYQAPWTSRWQTFVCQFLCRKRGVHWQTFVCQIAPQARVPQVGFLPVMAAVDRLLSVKSDPQGPTLAAIDRLLSVKSDPPTQTWQKLHQNPSILNTFGPILGNSVFLFTQKLDFGKPPRLESDRSCLLL